MVGPAALSLLDTIPGARALAVDSNSLIAVGDSGSAASKFSNWCKGRPFVVDGTVHTASLSRGPSGSESPTGIDEALAAAWARDGLYEHASIASFARFGLELLALGAPPRLLREVLIASHDELVHAQLCFGLARRFGKIAVGPGPMPIPRSALARVGDPVATALVVLDEGCINESIAACEAAEAAEGCRDPEVREVLERIAADERRHALLAWDSLRWLIARYGEDVRAPLRDRLARLGVGRVADTPDDGQLADHEGLAEYGQLTPRRRALVRQRVLVELVHPLAHAMLTSSASASILEVA